MNTLLSTKVILSLGHSGSGSDLESSNIAVAKSAEDGGPGTSLHDVKSIEELRGTVMRLHEVVVRQQNIPQAEGGSPRSDTSPLIEI